MERTFAGRAVRGHARGGWGKDLSDAGSRIRHTRLRTELDMSSVVEIAMDVQGVHDSS
jgi:hypothetical protein